MKKAGDWRQRAERYRRLERQISDPATVRAIRELAREAELTAGDLDRHCIRERAHEIWIERGRPEGRDVEFWLAAERELAGRYMGRGWDGAFHQVQEEGVRGAAP